MTLETHSRHTEENKKNSVLCKCTFVILVAKKMFLGGIACDLVGVLGVWVQFLWFFCIKVMKSF